MFSRTERVLVKLKISEVLGTRHARMRALAREYSTISGGLPYEI